MPPIARLVGDSPLLLILLLAGCVSARIQVVDERTALENQILGSYQQLDKNLQTLASVRAAPEEAKADQPQLSDIRMRAIQARQVQLFHRDDVDELKAQGCLGEGREARLLARPCTESSDPAIQARIDRLLQAVNEARGVLLEFVLTTSPDLSQTDRPQVQAAAVQLYRQRAQSGHWLQTDDGRWFRKE